MKISIVQRLLLAGTAMAFTFPAYAQQADNDTEDKAEIIVTAGKVASAAQDTPIALNVYSGDQLAEQGVNSIRDLAQIDPSVNITNSTGAAYVAVRGIASADTTEIGDPSVPIARDGFFMNRSFSISSSMYDVARIEVLKGPQGTLQGRNSTGGLVSIITKRPEMRDGGYASVEVGNFGAFNGELGANIAMSDTFAVRASGVFLKHNGFHKTAGPIGSADDEDFASGRVQALFDNDTIALWASYQHDSRRVNGDAQFGFAPLGVRPASLDHDDLFRNFVRTYTNVTSDRFRWEASYGTQGGVSFVYSGGYDKSKYANALDATGLPELSSSYPAIRLFRPNEVPKTWNHEFRVNNDRSERLFFQAGYFRFSEDNDLNTDFFNVAMTGPFAPGGFLAGAPNADQSNRSGIRFDYNVKTESQAVFGQIEFDITDKLEISLGGRYTWDEKTRTGNSTILLPALVFPLCGNGFPAPGTCPPFPLVTPGNGKLNDEQPTWHVGMNYRPTGDTLIYAKYDRGYKTGGFNSGGTGPSVPYGPEQLDAFEIGSKNTLMNGALQLNASAFYFNYRGYQGSQFSAALDGGAGIFNVGSARILGAEADMFARLGESTRLNLAASYLDTKFGNDIQIRNGTNVLVDISGNDLPNAPGFTATAALEHDFSIGSGALTARIDGKYSSSYDFSVFNTPDTQQKNYTLANASLVYEPDNGPWKVQLFVRNIFDKTVLANATRNYLVSINTYQLQAPRTFGIRGSVKF